MLGFGWFSLSADRSAAQVPLVCPVGGEAFVVENQLARVHRGSLLEDPVDFSLFAGPYTYEINNIGFRRKDGLIWGWRRSPDAARQIVTVDAAGAVVLRGAAGLPPSGFNAGDVSMDGSWLYLSVNVASPPRLYRVPLPSASSNASCLVVGGSGAVADWATNPADGHLYGAAPGGEIAVLDPSTLTSGSCSRTDKTTVDSGLGVLPSLASGGYGAAWFDGQGNFYAFQNQPVGTIYKVEGVLSPSPTVTAIRTTSGDLPAGAYFNVDGASCYAVPFACDGEPILSLGSTSTLFALDRSTSPDTATVVAPLELPAGTGVDVDAIAYRPSNGLIYGAQQTPGGFVRLVAVDELGSVFPVGDTVPPLPTSQRYGAGAISSDGATLYLRDDAIGAGNLYRVDLGDLSMTSVPISGDTAGGGAADWAFRAEAGREVLWGALPDGRIACVDANTGAQAVSAAAIVPSGADEYGGAWIDPSNDRLYLYRDSGAVYELQLGTGFCDQPAGVPTLLSSDTVLGSAFSDATVCPTKVTWSVLAGRPRLVLADRGAVLEWRTAAESSSLGFDVFREDDEGWSRVNRELIAATQALPGGLYRVRDPEAFGPGPHRYRIVERDLLGGGESHGPFLLDLEVPRDDGLGGPSAGAFTGSWESRPRRPSRARGSSASRGPGEGRSDSGEPAGLRIAVERTGLVAIAASEIAEALGRKTGSVKSALRRHQLALSLDGAPVPWRASPDGASLWFVAHGTESVFRRDSTYVLRDGPGLEMESADGRTTSVSGGGWFEERTRFEEDLLPRHELTSDPGSDYWYWAVLLAGHPALERRELAFGIEGLSPLGETASVSLELFGLPEVVGAQGLGAEISINGSPAGSLDWTESGAVRLTLPVDPALLRVGPNLLEVVATRGLFLVDSFEVRYPREYRAIDDRLLVRTSGEKGVAVEGLSSRNIAVFEVRDTKSHVEVRGIHVEAAESGYRVSFAPPAPGSDYLVVALPGGLQGAELSIDRASDLRAPSNRAEYLVITSDELLEAAEGLAAYRESRGLESMVVSMEDVLDEFSHAQLDPAAIRRFLGHATRNWSLPPRLVVLAGAGHYDYRDNLGFAPSHVPPAMVPTPSGLAPSDLWFGDVEGDDGIPEIAVGRLPFTSADQLASYVAKVEEYEASAAEDWTRSALIVADDADRGGDFAATSRRVAAALPEGISRLEILLGRTHEPAAARAALLGALDSGAALWTYAGHGGFGSLADEGLFGVADLPGLENAHRAPILVAMTCTIGFFSYPGFASLGEELVSHDGGAIAVLAPTTRSANHRAERFAIAFAEETKETGRQELGAVLMRALGRLETQARSDISRLFALLGDPGLEIQVQGSLP